ncbi:MAG TPA: DUF2569 family protein, partial [Acidobacteriota bacterium]
LAIVSQGGSQSWGGNLMVYNPLQLVLLAILALATGVTLLTVRNSNAVLLVRIYLGFYLVSNILVAFFGLKAPSGYYIIDREGLIVKSILQAVLINLVWQTYFLRSRRVKATYPPLADVGEAVQATVGKSLAALHDRKVFGIDYFMGIGFFLATLISGIMWTVYFPLVQSYPLEFPPASFFLTYRIPLLILESLLLVVLLHALRRDWQIAVAMGLGTMTLGVLGRLVFSGATFGSLHIRGGFNIITMINGFMWSFFIILGLALALRTWGRKWWSVVAWMGIGGLASDLIGQLLWALTGENFRFSFSSVPMDVIDGIVTGSILYFCIVLHLRKKRIA